MKKSVCVVVSGPLSPYAGGYRSDLIARGYAPWTVVSYLYSFARLSRWMAGEGIAVADLDAEQVARFVAERPNGRTGPVQRATPRGSAATLGYLRRVALAPPAPVKGHASHQALLDEFSRFLRDERGLVEDTIDWYLRVAVMFLASLPDRGADLAKVGAGDVNSFVLAQAQVRGTGSLGNVVTALRALLRFLYLHGDTPTQLAGAAPRPASWRDTGQSRGLPPQNVARLLASCDRRTGTGRRDFAILVTLSRLGLRANEAATLSLDDVHWAVGEITVHGKGNRTDRLPLPVDVGEAIAGYCRRGRPRGGCRALFVQSRAPYGSLTSHAVNKVVAAACGRCGMPVAGPHRLRHTTAAALRRAGAPLFEIGQLLRHQHAVTTAGYARDDDAALARVARRWPGSAS